MWKSCENKQFCFVSICPLSILSFHLFLPPSFSPLSLPSPLPPFHLFSLFSLPPSPSLSLPPSPSLPLPQSRGCSLLGIDSCPDLASQVSIPLLIMHFVLTTCYRRNGVTMIMAGRGRGHWIWHRCILVFHTVMCRGGVTSEGGRVIVSV